MAVSGKEWCNENLRRPHVVTFLAPSLPLHLVKVALHNLLWSADCSGNGTQDRSSGSRKHSQKSEDQPFTVKEGTSATNSTPTATSDCPGLHASKECKAVGHGTQSCSPPGLGTRPPPPPPSRKKKLGWPTGRRIGGSHKFPSTRKVGCGERRPTPVVPPTPGLRPAQVQSPCSTACRRRRRLYTDVAGRLVEPSPSAAVRVIPLRGGWTTVIHRSASCQGPAACSWEPEFQCKKARSAPVPCRWHASPICRRSEPQIMGEVISGSTSLSLPGLSVLVSHVALFQVGTYRDLAHCRSLGPRSGPSDVQSAPIKSHKWSATATGTPLESEGSSRSAPPIAGSSSSVNTRLSDFIANHLWEKRASKGPQTAALGSAGVPDNVMSRQPSYFGTTSLTRAADLAGPALTCPKAIKELQNPECVGGPRRPGLSVRAHPGCKVAGTRIRAMLDGFVDDFPQARLCGRRSSQEQTDHRLQWCVLADSHQRCL